MKPKPPMNRNQRRVIRKLTAEEIYILEMNAFKKGIDSTLKVLSPILYDTFGFGKVRQERLRDAICEALDVTD